MFFVLPWQLRQPGTSSAVPAANLLLIAVSVLFYLFGWAWSVGPGTQPISLVLYAFSHCGFWHLAMNMWALWVFGNPLNRRLGNGYYLLVYLGTAVLMGLFARLLLPAWLMGSSGALFAVITVSLILMPRAALEIACVAIFPLTILVGLLSRPKEDYQWLVRWVVYPIPALWALLLIPLLQLAAYCWYRWDYVYLAHLLGMLCGLGIVMLLPSRVTMRRRWMPSSF